MLKGNVMTNIKTIFNTKYQSQQYGLILSNKNLTEHTGIQYKLRVSGIVHDSKNLFLVPALKKYCISQLPPRKHQDYQENKLNCVPEIQVLNVFVHHSYPYLVIWLEWLKILLKTLWSTSTNRHITVYATSNMWNILFSHQPRSSVAVVIMAASPLPLLVRANTFEEGKQTLLTESWTDSKLARSDSTVYY